ncbi:MAG: IS1595 family transposase [Holophagales bacterium]|nr:IS1595 family transposase [Holophagales bacterium]MYD21676.1 IS1595 family transposase [Holophagales bacterium]MYI32127.1 IS1595 family transposase [Holophagales bacterium]
MEGRAVNEKDPRNAPGRSDRQGMSIIEFFQLFPNDRAAEQWFEGRRWPNGLCCPDCGSCNTVETKNRKPQPYRCRDCRRHFNVRTGTVMQGSRVGYQKWLLAMYLMVTGIRGTAAMKVHRELKVSYKTAWYLMQRIREGFFGGVDPLEGTVEVDEVFIGGKQENRHVKDQERYSATDAYGKKVVVAAVERGGKVVGEVIENTDANTLTRFVEGNVQHASRVITDDHGGYTDLMENYRHRSVKHSAGEYVKDVDVHTNTVESLWSTLKRGYVGTYYKMSPKHLHRYVNEFTGRKNQRDMDTTEQLAELFDGFIGRRLKYDDLIAYNGRPSGARSGW